MEFKVVELNGSEKTWVRCVCDEFVRCISAETAKEMEMTTKTLRETNGSYRYRHWTNLPEFWDNHAIVSDAPETVFKCEYCTDAFEDEDSLEAWLEEDAIGFWDDGFTEWGPGEFDSRCNESVEEWMEDAEEIPFEEWFNASKND